MKEKISFVHISDVHLGANPYMIKDRYNDMKKVFQEAIEYSINNEVDFIVIPGDLFDKKVLNAETLDQAINLIKTLNDKNIPVYVTEGNHDMATYMSKYSWLEFMSQKGYIYLLKPVSNELKEWNEDDRSGSIIENENYIIYGLGYPGVTAANFLNNVVEQYRKNKEGKIVISMLHAGIDKFVTEGMGGLREEEIEGLVEKSDYIALGHIHQKYENKEKKYYNPGSLENTSIPQKIEDKGFYSVSIDVKSKNVETEFIKVSNRRIVTIVIDLASKQKKDNLVSNEDYILEIVAEKLKEEKVTIEDNAILQIKLKGDVEATDALVDVNRVKENLIDNYKLLYVEIQNKLNGMKTNIDYDDENLVREDIDKMVIRSLIADLGFDTDDVDKLLNITLKMKDASTDEFLTLEKEEGNEVKEEVLKFIREKRENK